MSSNSDFASGAGVPASAAEAATAHAFTGYQIFVVAVLAFLQFTIILNFAIISPLGAIIMPDLHIDPRQFGEIVSAYAFCAGISGLLAAAVADRFDRKSFLLLLYVGFIAGTAMCALARSYHLLLAARMFTGVFGGVIGSVVLAIATDLFPLSMRGRVMGYLQTAFSASQLLGIPAGLYLANVLNWHAAFLAIVLASLPVALTILLAMKPVANKIATGDGRSALRHVSSVVLERGYALAFASTALLAFGGFVLMPFGSLYAIGNLGISLHDLPTIYLVSGLVTTFAGPLAGRASDSFGKFPIFVFGCALSIGMVLVYTHLPRVSLTVAATVMAAMFVGIFSRTVPSQALISAIPDPGRRGSFSAVNASLQQISGGIGSVVAGAIVAEGADGRLQHFDLLGYVVVGTTLMALALMYFIDLAVARRSQPKSAPSASQR